MTQLEFSKSVLNIQERLDNINHALPWLEKGIAAGWRNLPEPELDHQWAIDELHQWGETVNLLDNLSTEIREMELHYYQKLFFPDRDISAQEIANMPIVVNFAIVRAEWVLQAERENDPNKLKLLTRHELTYKTIAAKIRRSVDAVAHWHTERRLTRGIVPFELSHFYGLKSLADAWYIKTEAGNLIPYQMIHRLRHLAWRKARQQS